MTIWFSKPLPQEYMDIVKTLAERVGIEMDEETLKREVTKWEMSHGGASGRSAQQLIDHLLYKTHSGQ